MPKITIQQLQNIYLTAAQKAINTVCSKCIIKGGDLELLKAETDLLYPFYIGAVVLTLEDHGIKVDNL